MSTVRDFAITFTYIVSAASASDAMEVMGREEMEPERITVMPNLGV